MTAADKHWVEKDVIKFLRKSFASQKQSQDEESKDAPTGDKPVPMDDIPLKGVAKKRGTNFAFLQFHDIEEKKRFQELFAFTITPKSRYHLKEAHNPNTKKGFFQVKGRAEM